MNCVFQKVACVHTERSRHSLPEMRTNLDWRHCRGAIARRTRRRLFLYWSSLPTLVWWIPNMLIATKFWFSHFHCTSSDTSREQHTAMTDLTQLPKDWVRTSGQFTKTIHDTLYPAIDPTRPENLLRGKTVVVTGASRGIGANGIATAFARAGVRTIVITGTNASKLMDVEKKLKKINPRLETLKVTADISSAEHVEKAWSVIKARCPKIHVLVNNAGVEATESGKLMHNQAPEVFFRNFVWNMCSILLWNA